MSGLSEQGWQNQIQALEATLAEMAKRVEAAERECAVYRREFNVGDLRFKLEKAEARCTVLEAQVESWKIHTQSARDALQQKIDSAYVVFQRANAAEAEVARLKALLPTAPPPVDPRRVVRYKGIGLKDWGADNPRPAPAVSDLRALRDAVVDSWATHRGVEDAERALAAALQAKQGEVGK